MKNHRIQLFHNQYRHIVYIPATNELITYWFGNVPKSEQIKYIYYLQELIKIYEIENFVINFKKVKTISLQPTRLLFERVLTKAYQQGAKTLTFIQKSVKNEAFVLNAYINALKSYGVGMKVELVTA